MQALAEMVGTFILMFSVCGIIACTQLLKGEVGLLEYAATAGLTVVVVIFSIGPISGAHVNPAITIAFASFGHFPWSKVYNFSFWICTTCSSVGTNIEVVLYCVTVKQVPLYIIAQILGSVLATYVGQSVYGVNPEIITTRPLQGCNSAFWVELIASFIIMFLAASLTYQAQSVRILNLYCLLVQLVLQLGLGFCLL